MIYTIGPSIPHFERKSIISKPIVDTSSGALIIWAIIGLSTASLSTEITTSATFGCSAHQRK